MDPGAISLAKMKKVIKFVKGKKEEEPTKAVSVEPKKSSSFEKPEKPPEPPKEDDFLEDKSITKLHRAVWLENTDKLKTIIKTHDIDITDRLDRTALYFAVMKNNPLIIELLLENNASQNIPDIDGVTPFLKVKYVTCNFPSCFLMIYFVYYFSYKFLLLFWGK